MKAKKLMAFIAAGFIFTAVPQYSFRGDTGASAAVVISDYTFNTVDGATADVSADGKDAAVIIFGSVTCLNCRQTLESISQGSLIKNAGYKVMFIDTTKASQSEVQAYSDEINCGSITFCYDETSTANSAMFSYAGSSSVTYPVIIYMDSADKIIGTSTGKQSESDIYAKIGEVRAEAVGINVNYRTKQEIMDYINAANYDMFSDVVYDTKPDFTNAPYSAGSLSHDSINQGLEVLNIARYIAGIDPVTINEEYNGYAQAAATVNAAVNELTHSPEKPEGMDDTLYSIGAKGAGSSNLGMGYSNLPSAVMFGWMDDSDYHNIDVVGHRRWCLNPSMGQTGFGFAGDYSAMYAFDTTNKSDYYGVSWPAQNMPLDFFSNTEPWSISMGYTVDEDSVKVDLVRKSDGKQWSFSSASADGAFYVNNGGYGETGCIIFRPDDIEYSAGDRFDVTITGLNETVSYSVDFFELNEKDPNTKYTCYLDLDGFPNLDSVHDVVERLSGFTGKSYSFTAKRIGMTCDINVNGADGAEASVTANITGRLGDVNGDLKISSSDASLIFSEFKRIYRTGQSSFDNVRNKWADVNGDEKVTAADASIVFSQYKKEYRERFK